MLLKAIFCIWQLFTIHTFLVFKNILKCHLLYIKFWCAPLYRFFRNTFCFPCAVAVSALRSMAIDMLFLGFCFPLYALRSERKDNSGWKSMIGLFLLISFTNIYTQQKKETHHYDFHIKLSFWYENVNCHDLLISDQILLKLEFGVDEYLFPA